MESLAGGDASDLYGGAAEDDDDDDGDDDEEDEEGGGGFVMGSSADAGKDAVARAAASRAAPT